MTTTWQIANLEYNNDNDKGVVVAHWRCTGTDGENTASAYGTTSHQPDPTAAGYIAFDALTEADVLSWVWGSVDKAATEANIQAQLDAQANPTTLSGMPWAS